MQIQLCPVHILRLSFFMNDFFLIILHINSSHINLPFHTADRLQIIIPSYAVTARKVIRQRRQCRESGKIRKRILPEQLPVIIIEIDKLLHTAACDGSDHFRHFRQRDLLCCVCLFPDCIRNRRQLISKCHSLSPPVCRSHIFSVHFPN